MVPDEMARYKQLLYLAAKLPPLPAEDHVDDNKVRGCVSQVWVVGDLADGKLKWRADSDSQLTKGLAALLVQGLGDCSPEEVIGVDPGGIIEALGLKQKLTPSRTNGFLNMFRLMQQKAAQLSGQGGAAAASVGDAMGAQAAPDSASQQPASPTEAAASAIAAAASPAQPPSADGNGSNSGNGGGSSSSSTPVFDSMQRKLEQALQPTSLHILDESSQHAGHVGSRMKAGYSGETHFKVEVTSAAFQGMNTVKRHRMIYKLLADELAGTVHALSLNTLTPDEAPGS